MRIGLRSRNDGCQRKPTGSAMGPIAAAMLFAAVCSSSAQPLPHTFNNPLDGFSVSLPDGWVEMSREELETANEVFQLQRPGWKHPLLHYGYRMTNSAGLAFSPILVIRASDIPSNPKAILDEMTIELPPQGVVAGKPSFDEKLDACVLHVQADLGGHQVDAVIAYFLTRIGVIKMFFYLPKDSDPKLAALVQDIIRNVHVSGDMNYIRAQHGSPAGLCVTLAAMAVIAVVLSRAKPATAPRD
jgi:hypothetical protein